MGEVPSDGSVPLAGLDVLGHGALLQEDTLSIGMEYDDMRSAVNQAGVAMAARARCGADDLVVFIDDIEVFFHRTLEILPVSENYHSYNSTGCYDPEPSQSLISKVCRRMHQQL